MKRGSTQYDEPNRLRSDYYGRYRGDDSDISARLASSRTLVYLAGEEGRLQSDPFSS